jgi:hypothetical protein
LSFIITNIRYVNKNFTPHKKEQKQEGLEQVILSKDKQLEFENLIRSKCCLHRDIPVAL